MYAVAPMFLSLYLGDAYTFDIKIYLASILTAYVCSECRYLIQHIEAKYCKRQSIIRPTNIEEIVKAINMIHINIEDSKPETISYSINTTTWNLSMRYRAMTPQEVYVDVDTTDDFNDTESTNSFDSADSANLTD